MGGDSHALRNGGSFHFNRRCFMLFQNRCGQRKVGGLGQRCARFGQGGLRCHHAELRRLRIGRRRIATEVRILLRIGASRADGNSASLIEIEERRYGFLQDTNSSLGRV